MSAKTVGTPAVKFVETLQGAITVRADQDTILMVTYGHVKVIFQLIYRQRNHPLHCFGPYWIACCKRLDNIIFPRTHLIEDSKGQYVFKIKNSGSVKMIGKEKIYISVGDK